jgi:hypothetical protein
MKAAAEFYIAETKWGVKHTNWVKIRLFGYSTTIFSHMLIQQLCIRQKSQDYDGRLYCSTTTPSMDAQMSSTIFVV